ncbi:TonB-dependent receptor [Neolewinella aurantiaca]|uniref:TonB-dependent receptor n=1 Tax=Neolewinella aurantiaca TaxID=2602767 RepID=A0A5C7FU16_9BACT|nr:TonB-dependent receptor plug domain-containing protein [Neolewinella aurantiaca]TXF91644.1 TonB-dependent receptor [Neolewinella aurantiaca]
MRFFTLLLVLFYCTCVRAQTADTLRVYDAPTATVRAYGDGPQANTAAPVVRLPNYEIERYDESSLLSGLNRIPGVRFEERATASYRIAIRGASLRAPFGVRNTQVYWNGIPYGDPGGDVPLNFLDASNIDRVEVIKGPSGGFYGPGTAGTLLLETESIRQEGLFPSQKRYGEASITAGSFGYLRADLTLQKQQEENTNYSQFRAGYQRTDGYRDHSAMDRLTLQYSSVIAGKKQGDETKLHALYTKLDYELPGGLTAEQYADNPRQARPGSADKNASIHYHNLLLGLTNTKYLGRWKAETALYTTGFYFDHPFNFDYKREANLGAGGRVALRRLLRNDLDFALGVESKLQYRTGQNFTNPDGTRPGELNFSDEILSQEGLLFGQLNYTPGAWDFHLGLSSSQLDYTIDRTFDADGNTGETEFSANRPLSLRLAAGRSFDFGYLYFSRTDGFSPPTLDEFRTNEGSLNVSLDPEVGTNYEVGFRTSISDKLSAEINVFYFALDEAITSFTDERGTQLFRNSGKTKQQGVEIAATYQALNSTDHSVDLDFYGSYTYYDFTYGDFQQGDTDFTGNDIPGAVPQTINLEANLSLKNGLYLNLFHNYTDAVPLNDANDVFADSFHLLRAKIGCTFKGFDVFLTGSNLLDQKMSFGNDLNPAFGNRYYQPAPGRNFQAGIRKSW